MVSGDHKHLKIFGDELQFLRDHVVLSVHVPLGQFIFLIREYPDPIYNVATNHDVFQAPHDFLVFLGDFPRPAIQSRNL